MNRRRAEILGCRFSDPSVAIARHEVRLTLAQNVAAAAHLLKSGGSYCTVYPSQRLDELLNACREHGLSPKVLRLIHPKLGAEASLALLRAEKGARGGLSVVSPLLLHPAEGDGRKYSEEASRLLGGEDISCA